MYWADHNNNIDLPSLRQDSLSYEAGILAGREEGHTPFKMSFSKNYPKLAFGTPHPA